MYPVWLLEHTKRSARGVILSFASPMREYKPAKKKKLCRIGRCYPLTFFREIEEPAGRSKRNRDRRKNSTGCKIRRNDGKRYAGGDVPLVMHRRNEVYVGDPRGKSLFFPSGKGRFPGNPSRQRKPRTKTGSGWEKAEK